LQLLNELVEALVDVAGLSFVQPLDLLFDVLDELPVVVIDPFGVQHELVEIVNILLYNVGHVLQLRKLVAIVVRKHALRTHDRVAKLAEVFYLFVRVLVAVHFSFRRLQGSVHQWLGTLIDAVHVVDHVPNVVDFLVGHDLRGAYLLGLIGCPELLGSAISR